MKNFTFLMLFTLIAFAGTAQKSALIPTTFSAKDKMLIASVLEIENDNVLEDKDKARAARFKNMTVDRDSTYYDVELPATFPDGQESLKRFLAQNLGRPKGSKGETVLIRFMVERYGEISKVHVLASPSDSQLSAQLSAEAIKVVKKMGSWNPAKIQGIEVASYYVLPVKF